MTIFWDWNGTLLNDVDMCVNSMNQLLRKRHLPMMDRKRYRDVFSFPVKDYYEQVGFNFKKETFEIPAREFMDLYHRFLPETQLFPCATEILEYFGQHGVRQVILSAMEHQSLMKTLKDRHILKYFDSVSGIDNIYAGGKTEMARTLFGNMKINKTEAVLIGDTLHDWKVARTLGISHWLVAAGHQSKERLLEVTPRVVDSLMELKDKIST